MKKQFLISGIGLLTVILLFIFGDTIGEKKPVPAAQPQTPTKSFDIQQFITEKKERLSPSQTLYIAKLENGISRGDVVNQQIKNSEALAAFWKDSLKSFEPYAFYIAEAAKLDNSEKNLTFAARLFSENLRSENDEAKLQWQTTTAIDLFERAIKLNPGNDDLRIGLGSCYIFGRGRNGDPQQTMAGIQELLTVVRKDSNNMKAQMMLGVGGIVSGQYDKATERLIKVVTAQPGNVEAIAFLADAYAGKGDKAEAIKWYNVSKRLINNPEYTREADERIRLLK
ncbi:MAG: tetratricopeptide repeat protein [Ferruginibacter sp.]